MKTDKKIIIKNLLLMVLAAPIGSFANFMMTIIIARYLKSNGFGLYSQMFSLISIFQVVIETSRTTIIRDISQTPDKLLEIFSVAKGMLWALSLICFISLIGVIYLTQELSSISVHTFILAGIGAVAMFHAIGYGIIFVATERMEFNAIGSVTHKLLALCLVYGCVIISPSLNAVFTAIAVANLFLWKFYIWIFNSKYGRTSINFKYQKIYNMLKQTIVVGGTAIIRRLAWNVDIILLSWLLSTSVTGIFNGAYNIIYSLNMIPWIGTLVFFPMFSRMAVSDSRKLIQLTWKILICFFIATVPSIYFFDLYVEDFITFILGENYFQSIPVMKILIWNLPFSLPISMLFYIFTALNLQNIFLTSAVIALLVNTIADLILIPAHGPVGAAYGTLIADILCFTGLVIGLIVKNKKKSSDTKADQ